MREAGNVAQILARQVGGLAAAAVAFGPNRMFFQQFFERGDGFGVGEGRCRQGLGHIGAMGGSEVQLGADQDAAGHIRAGQVAA